MAKGIKKTSAVKKKLITDLTISSVDSGDRGAGDGCRIELIKRDPLLTAIDRAFASTAPSRNRSLTAPAARALTGGRPDCGRSSTRGSGRFDGTRPADPADDRPSLSAGSDPSDLESGDAFADRDGARRFRQNASPDMATPEGRVVARAVGGAVGPAQPDGAAALRAHAEGGRRTAARR